VKTERIKVERSERVEICVRRAGESLTMTAIGPCTVSVVTSKQNKARPDEKG